MTEAGWKLGGQKKRTVRRVIEGTVLSLFLAKAKKNTCEIIIIFLIVARKKLRSAALFEFNLKSNSDLQIMQLLWWTYKKNKNYFSKAAKKTYNLQT